MPTLKRIGDSLIPQQDQRHSSWDSDSTPTRLSFSPSGLGGAGLGITKMRADPSQAVLKVGGVLSGMKFLSGLSEHPT